MESLDAILKMNEKHPAGRRSTSIADLCARVEELEKERRRLVSCAGAAINAWVEGEAETAFDQEMAVLAALLIEMEEGTPNQPRQGPQEAPGQAGPSVAVSCAADAELLAFLGQCPCSLKRICDQFRVPYAPPPYTPEARAIRNQLQRLRKDKRVCSYGGRWELW